MASQIHWERNEDPVGIWEHRGKVALVGRGHSAQTDRRWDGVSMDKTLGAKVVEAARAAIEDAGISPDEVDGVVSSGGGQAWHISLGSQWGPLRDFFDPPYDTEDGLT
ncbi:MAG: hypothetical protein F4056_05470 [Chloroflexi bacterium]|nr:hypothetical protein [Chloroflexota bacterium]